MNERRRLLGNSNASKTLYTKRFYPSGKYYWTVPEGCTEVDVFLVGGGGACRTSDGTTAYGGNGGDGTVLIRYYAY